MYATKKKYIFWLVIVIALFIGFKLIELNSINNQMDSKLIEYQNQLDKAKLELKETKEKENYYKSDEYIEKVAREQTDLVKKNDIIFVTKK